MIGSWNYLARTLVLAGFVALGWLGWMEVQRVLGVRNEALAEKVARIEELDAELAASEEQLVGLRRDVEQRDERIGDLEQDVAERDVMIGDLEQDVAERDLRIEEQAVALSHLKVDRRLGRLTVLDQSPGPGGEVETLVRFEELDAQGERLGEAVEAALPGRVAYVESLVIKFDDDYVEQGDMWRGTSLCLFRRLFSEAQSPEEGIPLDVVGERPLPYADDRDPDVVDRLWLRFWDYANDPQAAADAGVRAIHGEAPFIQLRPGQRYLVELRASGGLSLRSESP